jgi:glycosyltransferase involved in cell wall biosynthesis
VLPYVDASQSGSVVMSYRKGIPVIVTDVGGLPEMVVYGESGIVVKSKDIVALAEGILYVLENECRYQRMSSFARELASKDYSWEKIAKMVIEKVYCIN